MAVTVITPDKLTRNTPSNDVLALTAPTTAADGFTIDVSDIADQQLLLIFLNTNASTTARTYTIKKGNSLQGTTDLASGDIAAGKYGYLVIDSGKFGNVSGADRGLLKIIPSHAELKMAAVVLPRG